MLVFPLAFALGVPSIFEISKNSRWDRWLGELSYPLYMVHILVLSLLATLGLGLPALGIVAALACTAAAVLLVLLVDRPLEARRQSKIRSVIEGSQSRV
jgi:peptidoglycan/LPS O-acetylase OafA/YrhL